MIGASVPSGDDLRTVIIPNERVLNDPEPDEGNIHIEHDAFRVPGSRPEVVANRHQRRDEYVSTVSTSRCMPIDAGNSTLDLHCSSRMTLPSQ
jgi:hypothetical protein